MSDSSQRDAFLRAIIAEPDDDAPRLVFADWLDEHGEPERAEFIRLQIARPLGDAPGEREQLLLAQHGERWLQPWRALGGIRAFDWERGFAASVSFANRNSFAQHADAVLTGNPFAHVSIGRLTERTVAILADLPPLGLVRGLNLMGRFLGLAGLTVLLRSPFLSGLRSLVVETGQLHSETMRLIAGFSELRRLSLMWCQFDETAIATLAEHANLPRLETLALSRGTLRDPAIVALAGCRGLPALRDLNLGGNNIGNAGAIALAESPHFLRLRLLELGFNDIGTAGAQALLARSLEVLQLCHNPLGAFDPLGMPDAPVTAEPATGRAGLAYTTLSDRHLIDLASWPGLERVRDLDVSCNPYSARGLRRLAASPRMVGVRTLAVGWNEMHPNGLEALLLSPHLRELQLLRLSRLDLVGRASSPVRESVANLARTVRVDCRAGVTPLAAEWLAGSCALARIAALELGFVHQDVLTVLLQSPHLAGLHELHVGGSGLGPALAAAHPETALRRLCLIPPIKGSEVRAVLGVAHLASLTHLEVRYANLQGRAIVFAESPYLVNLECLDLRDNPIPADVAERLRERFGERVLLTERKGT